MLKNENLRMYLNKTYCSFSSFHLFVLCCFIFNDYENSSYNISNGFEIKARFRSYYSESIRILKILFVKHWIIIGFNIKKINIRTWWIVAFYKQHYFQFIWWIFVTECEDGFYNGSCILRCGNCKAGTACDKINGSCLDGCVDLYEPPFCTGVSSFFKF